jgi:hypothetical protein
MLGRDPNTTTLFVVGATVGEALLPIGLGIMITAFGWRSFATSVWVVQLALVADYLLVHCLCGREERRVEGEKPAGSGTLETSTALGHHTVWLMDLLTLSTARSKAYWAWLRGSLGHSGRTEVQKSVHFNPIVDICRFQKDQDSMEGGRNDKSGEKSFFATTEDDSYISTMSDDEERNIEMLVGRRLSWDGEGTDFSFNSSIELTPQHISNSGTEDGPD